MIRYDPDVHHRRSIRLKGYDYSQEGVYYVTLCTQGRECLFGEVSGEEMWLNDAGRVIRSTWEELPQRFQSVDLDLFVVMPNHLHGILMIVDGPCVRDEPCARPSGGSEPKVREQGRGPGNRTQSVSRSRAALFRENSRSADRDRVCSKRSC